MDGRGLLRLGLGDVGVGRLDERVGGVVGRVDLGGCGALVPGLHRGPHLTVDRHERPELRSDRVERGVVGAVGCGGVRGGERLPVGGHVTGFSRCDGPCTRYFVWE